MILKKSYLLFLFIFLFSQCTESPLKNSKCEKFQKASKEYLSCMEELVLSTNTVRNFKEFKKHKTLKSFFKQVEVIESK